MDVTSIKLVKFRKMLQKLGLESLRGTWMHIAVQFTNKQKTQIEF